MHEYTLTICDSRSDLEARLSEKSPNLMVELTSADARVWGYLTLDKMTIILGYADLGIAPQFMDAEHLLLVGINELLTCIDVERSEISFQYRLPTIFHEFLHVDKSGILVRDEIGFVLVSLQGEKLWEFLAGDIIEQFSLNARSVSGRTLGGQLFDVQFPLPLTTRDAPP